MKIMLRSFSRLSNTRLHRQVDKSPSAFSLVEVTLSIGIISFGLLAVVGLLPTGLSSVKNAQEQAFATQMANAIATCVQSSSNKTAVAVGGDRQYTALAPFNGLNNTTAIAWQVHIPGTVTEVQTPPIVTPINYQIYLDASGTPTNQQGSARVNAFVSISKPASPIMPGSLYICIAWPGNAANGTWTTIPANTNPASDPDTDKSAKSVISLRNQQGYIEKTLYFNAQ